LFKKLTPEEKVTLFQHLEDLRKALLVSVLAIVIAAFGCFYFSNELLEIIQKPLKDLGMGLSLVYIGVAEGFFVKMKLSLLGGLVIAFPIVAWEIWSFIAPALYPNEKRYVYTLFPIIILLFAVGVLFSYFTILKLILGFMVYISGDLTPMITVDKYLSFVMALTLPFGLVFELPVVVFFLAKIGVIGHEVLARNRKYAVLIIFVLAAALTPGPDPISQTMMAIPVCILYEVSIWVAKLARPKAEPDDVEAEA
jgi:sec-independent protein translocase protein TatC